MDFRKNLNKRISMFMICVFMIQLLLPTISMGESQEIAKKSFSDIKGHWAESVILECVENQFINGYSDGSFKPEKSITRAEFVIIANKIFKFSSEKFEQSFSDVNKEDWFYKDVEIAKANGYISGYPGGLFKPENTLTREEASVMLSNILSLTESSIENGRNAFLDEENFSSWSKIKILNLYNSGLVNGMPNGKFEPKNLITRAQSIKLLNDGLKSKERNNNNTLPLSGEIHFDKKIVPNASIIIFKDVSDEVIYEGLTDNKGKFYVELPNGKYNVTATLENKIGFYSGAIVGESNAENLDIELEEGCIIKGYLKDDKNNGIKEEKVYLKTNPMFIGKTDSRGYFSITVLKNREYKVFYDNGNGRKELYKFKVGEEPNLSVGNIEYIKEKLSVSTTGTNQNNEGSNSNTVVINNPILTSIYPESGKLGEKIKINGNYFGNDVEKIEVNFFGNKQGKMNGSIVQNGENELEVLVPGIISEEVTVSIVVDGRTSNNKVFHTMGISEATPGENIHQDTLNGVTNLIVAAKHETEIGLSPFLPKDVSDDVSNELNQMISDIEKSINSLTEGKTDEEIKIINDLLSSEEFKGQLDEVNKISDILSHSTTSEALGNIEEAKDMLRDVKDMLDDLAYVFTVARNTAVTMAAASLFYGDIATAATLSNIASQISGILESTINPARLVVTGILSILDMAPSKGVEDSLVFYDYKNDIGIDQYFKNLEIVYERKDPGQFYVEKTNRLLSIVDVIKSDIERVKDSNKVGIGGSELATDIFKDYEVENYLNKAYNVAKYLKEIGAVIGYSNETNTILKMKEYGDSLKNVEGAFKKIKSESKEKAEYYIDRLIITNITISDSYTGLPLNRKMYLINNMDEFVDDGLVIEANNFYKMFLSTELLLSRILTDMNFDYLSNPEFTQYGMDIECDPGSIAFDIYSLATKVIKISEAEIANIGKTDVEDGNDEDIGCIFVTEPYFFKGNMDFTSRDNEFLSVESILDSSGNGSLGISGGVNPISKMIGKMLQNVLDDQLSSLLKINLTDVDVELRVSFSDDDDETERTTSDIIDWRWIGSKETINGKEIENMLMIEAKKTGVENIIITPVFSSNEDVLKEDRAAFTVKRKIKAISGFEVDGPYYNGAEIDKVTNLDYVSEGKVGNENKGYIGDILRFDGFGFSKKFNEFQNVYFEKALGYNDTGIAEKWMQSNNEYDSFNVEIPDSLSGNMMVSIGLNGGEKDKWPSNLIDYKILDPAVYLMSPTAIMGESWAVWGRGFSHNWEFNKGIWTGLNSNSEVIKPPSLENPMETFSQYDNVANSSNHDELHNLHRRLDFIVPFNSESGPFHINTIGTLNTEDKDIVVRKLSNPVEISSDSRSGLRPSIARDNSTNRRMAVWIDQNDYFGNQLLASLIDADGSALKPVVISKKVGGISTAPEKPGISADNGVFQVVWTESINDNDELFFSASEDGLNWSQPLNLSSTPDSSSIQPSISVSDIDNDGDGDGIVAWTETDGIVSHIYSRIVMNNGSNYDLENKLPISSGDDAVDPKVISQDGNIAYLWSQGKKHNIYLSNYDYNSSKLEEPFNISNNSFENRYPSATYNINPSTNKLGLAIVWEAVELKESSGGRLGDSTQDIYFARYEDGQVAKTMNLTNSKRHSQRPEIESDGDNNLAIVWIEQGYEEENTNQDNKYSSYVMFGRSFNGGNEFNRPYIKLQSFNDSVRLGHPAISADKNGLVSILWQETKSDKSKILFSTTEGIGKKPTETIENNIAGVAFDGMILETDFGFTLAREDGTLLRKYMDIDSKPDFSPSGKYISYSKNWVMEAEADGSHPIGIFRAYNDEAKEVYWSQSEDLLSANFVEAGFLVFERNGLRRDKLENGINKSGHVVFSNPWFEDKILSNVILVDKEERTNDSGIKYLANIISDAYIEFLENYGENHHRFGENGEMYSVFSPDGGKIALLKYENNDDIMKQSIMPSYIFSGKLYTASSNGGSYESVADGFNASSPSWSPTSDKIAFINEDESEKFVYMVSLYEKDREPKKMSDSISDAKIVRFSLDGNSIFVLRNDKYSIIDIKSGKTEEYEGFPWAYLRINESFGKLNLPNDTISINEGEQTNVPITLSRVPKGEVTVRIFDNLESGITASENSLVFDSSNWNIPQTINIASINDDIFEGDRNRTIKFIIESDDLTYNDYINRNLNVWITEDEPSPGDLEGPKWTNPEIKLIDKNGSLALISYSEAEDINGIRGYKTYINNVLYKESLLNTISLYDLEKNTDYTIKVEAVDTLGNESITGPQITFKTDGENRFYLGAYYEENGYEVGSGQPINEGWSRKSLYDGPRYSGLKWYFKETENLIYRSPIVVGNDGTLYYTARSGNSDEGYIYAINSDGTLKWEKVFVKPMEFKQPAPTLTNDNQIICIGRDMVYSFDNNGDSLWNFKLDDDIMVSTSSAISEDGTIYFTGTNSNSKRLVLYSIKDGLKIWNYESTMYSDSTSIFMGNMFTTPITLKNGNILFGKDIVRSNGTLIGKIDSLENVYLKGTPVYGEDNKIYIAADDYQNSTTGKLYIVDGENNLLLKNIEIENPVDSGIAVDFNGNSYVGTRSGKLFGIAPDGSIRWEYSAEGKILGSPLIDGDGNIYFSTQTGKIYCVNSNGTTKWIEDMGIEVEDLSPLTLANDNLYLTSSNGIYSIGAENSGSISFEMGSMNFNENDGTLSADIVRTGDNSGDCIVYVDIDNSSTLENERYSFNEKKIILKAGESKKSIEIQINDDNVSSGNKTIIPYIKEIVGGPEKGNFDKINVTVIDNEYSDVISLEKDLFTVSESNNNVEIKINRIFSGINPTVTDVEYQLNGGTAIAGTDFTNSSGTVNFETTDMEKIISIPIVNREGYQGNRKFSIQLKNQSAQSTIGISLAEIEIIEDDEKPTVEFEFNSFSVNEDCGNAQIKVIRTGELQEASGVFVEIDSSMGTATNMNDFQKFSGTHLSFGSGDSEKSFSINIIDDSLEEAVEKIYLYLSNPEDATLGTKDHIEILINDNDQKTTTSGGTEISVINGQSFYLAPGSSSGTTKLNLLGRDVSHTYGYAISSDSIDIPNEGITISDLGNSLNWNAISSEETDNIPASIGEYMIIIEAEDLNSSTLVLGFSKIFIGGSDVTF